MALGDFLNFYEFFKYSVVEAGLFKENSHVGTGLKSDFLGFYYEFRAGDHPTVRELLDPLVDCCTGHITLPGNFQVGYSRVPGDQLNDLFVQTINL